MSNICIVLLIGIPGVGKTQICKYLQRNINNFYVIHVNYDRYDMHPVYKDFRWNILKSVENLLQDITQMNFETKWIILIDDNMYYRSMRRNYYNLAKKINIGYCQLYLTCGIDVALKRNRNRSLTFVSEQTVRNMLQKLEKPCLTSWEKYSLEIETVKQYTEREFNKIVDLIQCAMQDPVKFIKIEHPSQTPSEMHRIDLILRKIVHEKLSENKENLSETSKKLIEKKKYILNGFKTNLYEVCFENYEALYGFLYCLMDI